MSKLTEFARGQACLVRLPGVCTHNPETTVLAHYRLAPYSGTAVKPPDLLGAFACASCHAVIDGQVRTDHDREYVRHAHAEGVLRTLVHLWHAGKVRT